MLGLQACQQLLDYDVCIYTNELPGTVLKQSHMLSCHNEHQNKMRLDEVDDGTGQAVHQAHVQHNGDGDAWLLTLAYHMASKLATSRLCHPLTGSPTAMPGFLNLFGSARRAAAQGSEACGSQPAPVPPAPQLDKPALQSCSGESLGQRDGGAPTLHKLAADVGSGGSLPIPDTPAAGEELRGRLLQASCSLTTSALLHLQPRPGSAGSEEGGCSGTSTDIAAASCQQSHLARDSQVLGGAPAAGGHPFKLETHGGVRASVVAVPGPGLGALGKWAASAMAQGMPEQDGHSKQQEEEEGGQALSGGLVSPVHGTIEVSRCSPISDLPVSKRPQAIKAAAK